MNRLTSITVILVAAILVTSQEPGPPPRVVYERPEPGRVRLYTVQVFRDGQFVGAFGADHHWELDELLYTLALRWCTSPREWVAESDYRKRPSKIEVAIWDEPLQLWIYPDIKRPGKREFFALPLTVRVNVGSTGIE